MLEPLTSEPTLRLVVFGFIALCAVMGFLRGVGRLVLLALALAAGAAAALAWFRFMPALCISWWGKNPEGFIKYGALGAGLLGAWLARRLLHGIVSSEGPGPLDRKARVRGGLLGLVPALLLVWGGAIAVRWAGAASQLRHLERAVEAQNLDPLDEADLLSRLGLSLSQGTLGSVLNRLDPMSSRESAVAASLLVLQRQPVVWERAVRHPQAGPVTLLESFKRLRNDNDVSHALSFSHYSRLLALPEMETALDDRTLREALLNLEMERVLTEIITGRLSSGPPRAQAVPEQ
jgi:hypothetical protein